jgi:hypothetical protein
MAARLLCSVQLAALGFDVLAHLLDLGLEIFEAFLYSVRSSSEAALLLSEQVIFIQEQVYLA